MIDYYKIKFIDCILCIIAIIGFIFGYQQYYGGVLLLLIHLIISCMVIEFVIIRIIQNKRMSEFIIKLISGILFSSLVGLVFGTIRILNDTVDNIHNHSMSIYILIIMTFIIITDILLIIAILLISKNKDKFLK